MPRFSPYVPLHRIGDRPLSPSAGSLRSTGPLSDDGALQEAEWQLTLYREARVAEQPRQAAYHVRQAICRFQALEMELQTTICTTLLADLAA